MPLRHWKVEDLEIRENRALGWVDTIRQVYYDDVIISGKIRHTSNPHDPETRPANFFMWSSPSLILGSPIVPEITKKIDVTIPHPGTTHADVFSAELKALWVFPTGTNGDIFFTRGYTFNLTAQHETIAPEVVEIPYDGLMPGTSIGIYWALKNKPGVINAGAAVVDSTGAGKVKIVVNPESIETIWRHETPFNIVLMRESPVRGKGQTQLNHEYITIESPPSFSCSCGQQVTHEGGSYSHETATPQTAS